MSAVSRVDRPGVAVERPATRESVGVDDDEAAGEPGVGEVLHPPGFVTKDPVVGDERFRLTGVEDTPGDVAERGAPGRVHGSEKKSGRQNDTRHLSSGYDRAWFCRKRAE
jgi:hypothetical protein